MVFKLKAHDRRPSIQTTLSLAGVGPVDLTGATVTFIMRAKASTGAPAVNAPAVIVDAANGVVRFDWRLGDTATPGDYQAEWQVVQGGLAQTFPTDAYDDITIYADLDSA